MSSQTPRIFEALCAGFSNPFPPEPINPNDWQKIDHPRICFDKMMSSVRIETNSRPDLTLFALARELWRRGYNYLAIEKEILRFNEHCLIRPLPRSRARLAILGYDKKEFYHCCSHDLLREFCVGFENCDWLKRVTRNEQKNQTDIEKFQSMYGSLLRTDVKRVYLLLMEIEEKNRLRSGQTVFRSYRQIALALDFTDKGIAQRACKKLVELGLLKIVFQGRGGIASSNLCSGFQRVSPVPPPHLPEKGASNV